MPGAVIDERPEPLTLAEVLDSVLVHYPLLQAIERERGIVLCSTTGERPLPRFERDEITRLFERSG